MLLAYKVPMLHQLYAASLVHRLTFNINNTQNPKGFHLLHGFWLFSSLNKRHTYTFYSVNYQSLNYKCSMAINK